MLPTGRLIKAARILIGWSQSQLAAKAGVSRIALARLEADLVDSRGSTIEKLVSALEKGGVRFIPATHEDEMGIALRKRQKEVAAEPSVASGTSLSSEAGLSQEIDERSSGPSSNR